MSTLLQPIDKQASKSRCTMNSVDSKHHVEQSMRESVVLSRKNVVFAAFSIMSVVCLSFIYFHMFAELPRDPDQTTFFLMAQDMIRGNWILRDWSASSDTFWTSDVLFEALPIAVFGPNPKIMFAIPAVMWAVIVVAAVCAGATRQRWSLAGVLLIATILGAPILRSDDPMQMIARSPMHIGSIIYMLWMFFLAARVLEGRGSTLTAMACAALRR